MSDTIKIVFEDKTMIGFLCAGLLCLGLSGIAHWFVLPDMVWIPLLALAVVGIGTPVFIVGVAWMLRDGKRNSPDGL